MREDAAFQVGVELVLDECVAGSRNRHDLVD
jgi:hypothetical protein